MAHDCRSMLCVTPHFANDDHVQDCLCEGCHPEHTWQMWNVYPGDKCEGCEASMVEWLQENIDELMCECGSFRLISKDPDNPECVRCYADAGDAIYESLKEARR